MLAYERLQTLLGRVIYAPELAGVARLLNTNMELFFKEESIEPWKPAPEYIEVELLIDNPGLNEWLENTADTLGICPDDVASRIVKEYVDRYSLEVTSNEL